MVADWEQECPDTWSRICWWHPLGS
jgi:hypothetical protein